MIWQGLLEFARIAWDIAHKDADRAATYDDMLGNYDKIGGGNELLYHINNTKTMHWNITTPNVGLVNHVQVVH